MAVTQGVVGLLYFNGIFGQQAKYFGYREAGVLQLVDIRINNIVFSTAQVGLGQVCALKGRIRQVAVVEAYPFHICLRQVNGLHAASCENHSCQVHLIERRVIELAVTKLRSEAQAIALAELYPEHFAVGEDHILQAGPVHLCIAQVAVNELCINEAAGRKISAGKTAILKATALVLAFLKAGMCVVEVGKGLFVYVGEFHWGKYRKSPEFFTLIFENLNQLKGASILDCLLFYLNFT